MRAGGVQFVDSRRDSRTQSKQVLRQQSNRKRRKEVLDDMAEPDRSTQGFSWILIVAGLPTVGSSTTLDPFWMRYECGEEIETIAMISIRTDSEYPGPHPLRLSTIVT